VHGVFLLPGRRLHLLEAGAHDDLHVLAAEARDERQQSIAVLPPPSTITRLPILSMWPKETLTASRCRYGCWLRGFLAAGNVEIAPARRAGADEDRVVASRAAPSGCRRAAAAKSRRRDRGCSRLLVDHRIRQAEFRDLRAHHAAGLRVAVEDHDLVAERREVARDGQRGRAAPMQATRLPFFWRGPFSAGASRMSSL
jgi:hypothetical protein